MTDAIERKVLDIKLQWCMKVIFSDSKLRQAQNSPWNKVSEDD
jgi:hypothetical protein